MIGKNILQVTKPCPGMRAAMASAKVGDDVYGEDPTTKLLEVFFIIVNLLDKMLFLIIMLIVVMVYREDPTTKLSEVVFIGPESDHWECLSVTH